MELGTVCNVIVRFGVLSGTGSREVDFLLDCVMNFKVGCSMFGVRFPTTLGVVVVV